ncbi:hypothetical protein GF343_05775 [Candidatus Woesearchaeota archaeon]|nr:hypothetical protein [Candidatus Woesearchaeota archaeon]
MAVADSEQEAKIIGITSRAYQEAWSEIISLIARLEDYLETKYNTGIDDLEQGKVYAAPETGGVWVADKVRIPLNTIDFQILDFLKKSRVLFADLANLGALVKKLPASATEILNNISPLQARANALLRTSEAELEGFKDKTRNETAILRITTDLATIQKYAHTLMELSLSKKAAAA